MIGHMEVRHSLFYYGLVVLSVLPFSALVVERLCVHGANYLDNQVLHRILCICYIIIALKNTL